MKRTSLESGLLIGCLSLFFIVLGVTSLTGSLVQDWFKLSSPILGGWLLLFLMTFWGGTLAFKKSPSKSWSETLRTGLSVGLVAGIMLALTIWGLGTLNAQAVPIREWLVQLTPAAIAMLTMGRAPVVAALLMFVVMLLAGIGGAAWAYAALHYQWRSVLNTRWLSARESVINMSLVQKYQQHQYSKQIAYGVGALVLLTAPLYLGRYWNYTLGTVGLYVILGLGLNVVVGMAGLLDLGYVAFFAIGSYTMALLTAPQPHDIVMSFWLALPIGVLLAACAGVLLGIPVLRMRGDYLAIVTLGFGEIIRILSKSDVLTDFSGGPRGVRAVGGPMLFGLNLNNEFYFMYFIILGIIIVAYATHQLQRSRVGRAWMAIREDEDVAEAMGINTLKYKLLAFAMGSGFAGFSGALFASRNKFTGPEDFTLLVSINVLSLVIIGGMGSIPGVIVGALVLKGLPEMLRQLDDYRMLAFGGLLVIMMILRPEGLIPSSRRKMELHDDESEALVPDVLVEGGEV
ncbi:MAG: hypothetical protein JW981_09500 [Anaerolineae bacterium]|nr:hypothetical protein [Anaerolineae bacterium]